MIAVLITDLNLNLKSINCSWMKEFETWKSIVLWDSKKILNLIEQKKSSYLITSSNYYYFHLIKKTVHNFYSMKLLDRQNNFLFGQLIENKIVLCYNIQTIKNNSNWIQRWWESRIDYRSYRKIFVSCILVNSKNQIYKSNIKLNFYLPTIFCDIKPDPDQLYNLAEENEIDSNYLGF